MTVGWILEDATDRFYEATQRTPQRGRPSASIVFCPFCHLTFRTHGEFQVHRALDHAVERPVLLVAGREPAKSFWVRSKIVPNQVETANATTILAGEIGEQPTELSTDTLAQRLSELRFGELRILLRNERQLNAIAIETLYDAKFRIASSEELTKVEVAFEEYIAGSAQLTFDSIAKFRSDPRCTSGAAGDYAQGLSEYCLGVLIKERPSNQIVTTPYSEHRAKYGAALMRLADIDRPLATVTATVIRLAKNELPLTEVALVELLDNLTLLRQGIVGGATGLACPVDHGTDLIIDLAARMAEQRRWSTILEDQCRQISQSAVLDESDRQKACAIWALTARRLGANKSATEPLARIAAVYPFSAWAGQYLETEGK